jgi:(p)ppGpp synthase/HD superfamily hydrolase
MAAPRNYKLLSGAFAYAADWHREDVRKSTDIPVIAHLLAVASLVLAHGGSDEQAAAALLHDVAEDHGGRARLREIRKRFGPRVARMVRDCSDSLTNDPKRKAKWKKRKVAYIEHLRTAKKDALLVSCADKVYNARAIVDDARTIGPKVWERFNAGASKQAWYYRELSTVFTTRLTKEPAAGLARELAEIVAELEAEAAKAG